MERSEFYPAPANPIAEVLRPEVEPLSTLDHMVNYGRAALGSLGNRLSSVFESLPTPSKAVSLLGVTATAAAGASLSVASAFAEKSAETSSTATESARLSASLVELSKVIKRPSLLASSAQKIKFYDTNKRNDADAYIRKAKKAISKCLPQALISDTNANHSNPTGRHSNKYVTAWVGLNKSDQSQRLNMVFKKGFEPCNPIVGTLNQGEYYFLSPKQIRRAKSTKNVKNKYVYSDPYKRNDPSGHAIRSVVVGIKQK